MVPADVELPWEYLDVGLLWPHVQPGGLQQGFCPPPPGSAPPATVVRLQGDWAVDVP